jgi:hypothetical protein
LLGSALRETPDWLEEALANWSAWQWFKSKPVQDTIARYGDLEPFVQNCLDVSLPGYKDWRNGRDLSTWRKLATQLMQGNLQARATS